MVLVDPHALLELGERFCVVFLLFIDLADVEDCVHLRFGLVGDCFFETLDGFLVLVLLIVSSSQVYVGIRVENPISFIDLNRLLQVSNCFIQ